MYTIIKWFLQKLGLIHNNNFGTSDRASGPVIGPVYPL